ncbi:hypothetical protein Tco_1132179 [Tanacetum coccineum]|uniref:Uncharacterized protein n=1 Tax=Tanacetum coccineum TaxID=301880 RepID=A0ABQ5JE86_9ASTR
MVVGGGAWWCWEIDVADRWENPILQTEDLHTRPFSSKLHNRNCVEGGYRDGEAVTSWERCDELLVLLLMSRCGRRVLLCVGAELGMVVCLVDHLLPVIFESSFERGEERGSEEGGGRRGGKDEMGQEGKRERRRGKRKQKEQHGGETFDAERKKGTLDSTANLSDATVYAFLANQSNRSQLVHEDLEQIHEDDLEEIDLKWQLALLSMRARRYYQRTGKNITINGSDTTGYDKSKVEYFKYHKMGHFARECRGHRNQENRPRNQDNSRRTVNVEEIASKAMVAIDGGSFDWSYMADEEVPTNLALMAFSDSKEFQQPEFEGYGFKDNKSVCENSSNEIKKTTDAPIIEDWVSDCDEDDSEVMVLKSDNVQHKPEQANQPKKVSQNLRNNRTKWNEIKTQKLGVGFQTTKKACFVCGSFNHLIKDCDFHDKKMVQKPVLNNVKKGTGQREVRPVWNNAMRVNHQNFSNSRRNFVPTAVLTKSGIVPVSAARPINTAAPKSFGHPQNEDQGYVDNGCSRHMTGNMSYLLDYKEFDGGYVTLGIQNGEGGGVREELLNKKDERGIVIRNKVRLVAQDVLSAFRVREKLDEEVYVYQPPRVEDPEFLDKSDKINLKKFGFTTVKTASTPMETSKPLLNDEDAKDVDVYLYRLMIGSLMYLTASRPDIMFAVLRLGILRTQSIDLEAYTDSDYAGASLDRKSTTGAEYVAAASCCGQNGKAAYDELQVNVVGLNLLLSGTTKGKTINEECQIQALVDKKKVILTKTSIRCDLKLDDAGVTDCLPNNVIFKQLSKMSAKTTAGMKLTITMASAIICLSTNQKFNFSKYIFDNMVKHLEGGVKILLFLRITPLFDTMMVQASEEVGKDSDHPTDSN